MAKYGKGNVCFIYMYFWHKSQSKVKVDSDREQQSKVKGVGISGRGTRSSVSLCRMGRDSKVLLANTLQTRPLSLTKMHTRHVGKQK